MQCDQNSESLKTELRTILPQIEEMRKIKFDRKNQFIEVLRQIQSIRNEICWQDHSASNELAIDETDLSMKKLEEWHRELQALRKEKVISLSILHCSSIFVSSIKISSSIS